MSWDELIEELLSSLDLSSNISYLSKKLSEPQCVFYGIDNSADRNVVTNA